MLKDMYILFSENRTDLRVCLKMQGRKGDRMIGKGCGKKHHHMEKVGITLKRC